MNKYKFLGAFLHFVYRMLSFMTRKEYFFADGGEMIQISLFFGIEKFLQFVMLHELLKKRLPS